MKKILFMAAGAAAMMLGMSSCNGSSSTPKTFGDSLAYYIGVANGYGINENISAMPDGMGDKIDRDQFLAGLKTVLNTDTANSDYLSGLQMGMQMVGQIAMWEKAGIDFNRDLFFSELAKGLKADTINKAAVRDANDMLQPLMQQAMNKMSEQRNKDMVAQQKAQEEKFEANKTAGAEFINKVLASDKSAKKTESGLVYKINKMGNGAVAKDGDTVKVIYTGKTIDGKEFDSSKGEEVSFPTKGVIPGFAEALTSLPAGTDVTLYIPENLGYGRQGSGAIEPGSTLVFDLVIGQAEAPAAQ